MSKKIKLYYVQPKAHSTTLRRVDRSVKLATIVQNNWKAVGDYMSESFRRQKEAIADSAGPQQVKPPKPYGMFISDEKFKELCESMNCKMPVDIWHQGIPILYEGSKFVCAIVMSQSLANAQTARNERLAKETSPESFNNI